MIINLTNNPFRVLGVFSNSTLREITANKGKIMAFATVGKSVAFPADICVDSSLPERTVQSVEHAISEINLPNDKIRHALFWFINTSSIDDIAIKHIQNYNYEKASEIFSKKRCFSSMINRGVLAFLEEDLETAISNITELIHDDECKDGFVEAICGSTFVISEDDLAKLFIDELLKNISASELFEIFEGSGKSSDDDDYIKDFVIRESISLIHREIEKAKNFDEPLSEEYKVGLRLANNTLNALKQLNSILSPTDIQYQTTVDALARQILQCGINYYNTTEDEDSVEKAMKLQKYALKIAVSKLLKDRCQENVNILTQRKEFEDIGKYINPITKELESLSSSYRANA